MTVYRAPKGLIEVNPDNVVTSKYGKEFKTDKGGPWLHVGFVMPSDNIETRMGAGTENSNWFSSEYNEGWRMLLFDSKQRDKLYTLGPAGLSTKEYAGNDEAILYYLTDVVVIEGRDLVTVKEPADDWDAPKPESPKAAPGEVVFLSPNDFDATHPTPSEPDA